MVLLLSLYVDYIPLTLAIYRGYLSCSMDAHTFVARVISNNSGKALDAMQEANANMTNSITWDLWYSHDGTYKSVVEWLPREIVADVLELVPRWTPPPPPQNVV